MIRRVVRSLIDRERTVEEESNVALGIAIERGQVDIVKRLLKSRIDPNSKVQGFANALQAAAFRGNEKIVLLLLKFGADVRSWDPRLGNAIQAAAKQRQTNIVRILLDHGADIHKQGGFFHSALMAALQGEERTIVELLISKGGVDVNSQFGKYGGPLQMAINTNDIDIVRLLLDCGADIGINNTEYDSPLKRALAVGNTDILQLLLERGTNISDQVAEAPQDAAVLGRSDEIEPPLNIGVDVNAQGTKYDDVLRAAAAQRKPRIVHFLLNKGANVNAHDEIYGNVLGAAAFRGDVEMVNLLLDRGADINAKEGTYGSALYSAVFAGNKELMQILLDRGADPNSRNGSALVAAARHQKIEILRFLLDKGVDINVKDRQYGSALRAAVVSKNKVIIKILIDRGADVNLRDDDYGTVLQAAVESGEYTTVQLLLDHGANVPTEQNEYVRLLIAAASASDDKIMDLLLDKGLTLSGLSKEARSALLRLAAFWGKINITKLLLDKGVDINIWGGWFGSALNAAIAGTTGNRKSVIELLESRGADDNARVRQHAETLKHATRTDHKREEIKQLFLDIGTFDRSKPTEEKTEALSAEQSPLPTLSMTPYTIAFVNLAYHIGAAFGFLEKPVEPGRIRLCWTGRSGRCFYQEMSQKAADLEPLQSLVDHMIVYLKNSSRPEKFWQLKIHKGGFVTSSANTGGKAAQSSSATSLKQSGSTSTQRNLDSNTDTQPGSSRDVDDTTQLRQRYTQHGESQYTNQAVEEEIKKWIIVCLPGERLTSLEHVSVTKSSSDFELIKEIKRLYKNGRNTWQRLLRLRDVHKIRLVKFDVRHSLKPVENRLRLVEVPTEVSKYEAPDLITDVNWECSQQQYPGLESLPEFLMYLWQETDYIHDGNNGGHEPHSQRWYSGLWRSAFPKATVHQHEEPIRLPLHKNSPNQDQMPRTWQSCVRKIRLYYRASDFRLSGWLALFRATKSRADANLQATLTQPAALENLGIEIEIDTSGFYVVDEVPKRIRERLVGDPQRRKAVPGWGLWVEEDFIISWKALLIINIVPVAMFGLGVYESLLHGVTWIAISAFGVTLSAFLFSQWIAKTKDSKR